MFIKYINNSPMLNKKNFTFSEYQIVGLLVNYDIYYTSLTMSGPPKVGMQAKNPDAHCPAQKGPPKR
jgi:hypothetical protein